MIESCGSVFINNSRIILLAAVLTCFINLERENINKKIVLLGIYTVLYNLKAEISSGFQNIVRLFFEGMKILF